MVNYILSKSPNGLFLIFERSVQFDFTIRQKKKIDWNLLNRAWEDQYREMQYFVCDYLIAMKKYLTYNDIDRIERFVRTKHGGIQSIV